ncbi:flavin reductase family protein [Thermoproteota archaeon]
METNMLCRMPQGLYILCTKNQKKLNGMVLTLGFPVSPNPPLIAVSVHKEALTHVFINETKLFNLSLLTKYAPESLIRKFSLKSGKDTDKFQGISYQLGKNGVPVLMESTVGYLEAELVKSVDLDKHSLFIGNVTNMEVLNDEEPMISLDYQGFRPGKYKKAAQNYIYEESLDLPMSGLWPYI